MDYDYEESAPVKKEDKKKQKKLMEQQELSKMMSKRRKRRKKSAFHEAIEAEKPVFNPKDFDFSEFLDVSKFYKFIYREAKNLEFDILGKKITWSLRNIEKKNLKKRGISKRINIKP